MRPVLFVTLFAAVIVARSAGDAGPARAAPAASDDAHACFFTRDVRNFTAASSSVVYLRVGVNTVYKAELFSPSPDVTFTEGVALRHIGGGTSAICSPLDAEFVIPGPGGPRTYPLTSLRKLSADDIAALPPRDKP